MKTFRRGGVHPPQKKEASLINASKEAACPATVTIPLSQHIGAPAQACVSVGDVVKVGTKIAEAGGFISSPVHASISGKVKKIGLFPHPVLGRAEAIQIESDGKDEKDPAIGKQENVDALSPEAIRACVKEAGIVGLGGAAFPTHVKLSPPPSVTIDTVIINGAECEPFLTCDHYLMLYNPIEIIKGADLVMRALGAEKCFIGIEKNKMDALEVLLSKVRAHSLQRIQPVLLKVKYPQGAEKQLIQALTGREVPLRGLPMDIGVVVVNVGTARAVYDAIYEGKPFYERLVTVCGTSVKQSQNIKVRIGTSFSDLINAVGGLINYPGKVIMGGPMMGLAQSSLEVPVVKGTSGLLTFNPGEVIEPKERPCIRCGRCTEVCPMGLVPNMITLAGDHGLYDRAEELGVRDCIECGSCAFICPAKRRMVQSVKNVKFFLTKRDKTKSGS